MSLPLIRWVWEDKPKIKQIGTRSGRFSCKEPNLSNIPRGEYHCPQYPCIFEKGHEGPHQGIIPPGNVYVWTDPEYIGKFTTRPLVGFDRILGKKS
jgi:hypothetical protein